MIRWNLLFIAFFVVACGSASKRLPEQTSGREQRPLWVNDPLEFCQDEFLCAVGEGSSFYQAESEARKNLAKIFKVQVTGTTQVDEQSSSVTSPEMMESTGVTQEIYSSNIETVDEVLEGVSTSKKHEEDGFVFSLAQLEKRVAGKILKARISDLDAQIEQAYESNRRSLLPKALDLYSKKSGLVSYLTVLGMPDFSRGVSKEDLLKKKAQFDANPIYVLIEADKPSEYLEQTVAGELSTLGYKIVKKGKANFKLVLTSNSRREYLNVKGFERYNMYVKLVSFDQEDQVIGNLTFDETQNGRSLSQIKSMILSNFRQYFSENFQALELD